ncbi:hypothetical protein LUZ63_002354 [Rhynchospora breviuscula]|uniref:DDE Tnp4 domain-containing protein n=1 Tax=Rhynchospora breviuscula TaxID=2022672 RepID=A0A9Q0CZ40_9POAL|nr:hypothetical protein LUZ63_002354 [Rhynchospora breviuscula]
MRPALVVAYAIKNVINLLGGLEAAIDLEETVVEPRGYDSARGPIQVSEQDSSDEPEELNDTDDCSGARASNSRRGVRGKSSAGTYSASQGSGSKRKSTDESASETSSRGRRSERKCLTMMIMTRRNDALGAIDGTHILAFPDTGNMTQNVMASVDFDGNFMAVVSGWEGSAHDALILRRTLEDGFTVPEGWYYLVDGGYANTQQFLSPYRGKTYHLAKFQQRRSQNRYENAEELYNH